MALDQSQNVQMYRQMHFEIYTLITLNNTEIFFAPNKIHIN